MRFRDWLVVGTILMLFGTAAEVVRAQESLEPHVGPMTRERFLAVFEAVVFGDIRNAERVGETRPTLDGQQYLSKWTGPVRIAVFGAASDENIEELELHAKLLSSLTRLSISVVDARDPQKNLKAVDDFEIASIFSEVNDLFGYLSLMPLTAGLAVELAVEIRRALRNNPTELTCVAWAFGVTKQKFAITFIRSDLSKPAQSSCVVEETTQVLGLPNDVYGTDSVFNDDGRYHELTELDKKLIWILYDPRMKTGLTQREAMRTLRQILPAF